jgi:hypothetical protein
VDDDWRIDNGLVSLRARIYELLPGDWEFYGPIKSAEGWTVGARTRTPAGTGSPNAAEATDGDLVQAFRDLAEAIKQLELTPTKPN